MENGQKPGVRGGPGPIRDFTDLQVWRFARQLRIDVYRVCTGFPRNETYALASQVRRAAVSVTANIADGFGRFSYQENIQFCRQSRGSVFEMRDHFTTALDVGYISKEQFGSLDQRAISVIKLLNGFLRATRNRKAAAGDKS